MSEQNNDPLNFVRNLWGQMGFSLPGMVTPTVDTEEIGKQISDLKAVEGWLKMNLSMLQMTIQNLEMQQATLNAVRAMGEMAKANTGHSGSTATAEPPTATTAGAAMQDSLAQAAMWPWQMMQDLQAHMQAAAERAAAAAPATARASAAPAAASAPAGRKAPTRKPAAKKAP